MSQPTNDLTTREQRLNEVIATYLTALQAGQVPNRAELLSRHPDLVTELMAFFADHDQLEQIADPMRPASSEGPLAPAAAAEAPTRVPGETPPPDSLLGLMRYFGDYQLLEELARGGMGVVYKAKQLSLNRLVALKMILAGSLASPADVQRFHVEAEAAANLDHPNIVPIYDVGVHSGMHYFTMKLVEGGSLADRLKAEPSAASGSDVGRGHRASARLLAKVARAVHFAHQRRILHRDLKPANILLDAAGEPHVTDFGLAKRVEGDSRLTQSGAIVGTPSYMSPEQASGKRDVSTAADVYGLGAVLYEMLTGRPPFRAETPLDTLFHVLHDEPARPRAVNPRADRDLETICLKCLDKEPGRRYGSAEALAEDLERWLAGEPIHARRSSVAERTVKWAKRRPAVAGLATLVVLVAGLGVSGVVWKWREALTKAAEEKSAKEEAQAALKREAEALQKEQAAKAAALDAQRKETLARAEEKKAKEKAIADRDEKLKALIRADGMRISAEASAARHADPGLSLLLALEGVRRVPNHLTYNVLYNALDDLSEERTINGNGGYLFWARYTPDGRFLVTLGQMTRTHGDKPVDRGGRVWDAATGKEVTGWLGYNMPVGAADLSPDGKRVAVAVQGHQEVFYHDGQLPTKHTFTDRTTYIWDTATGKDVVHLRRHNDRVVCVRFSPDGKKVVTGSWDNTARIWDAATGRELRVLTGHQCSIQFVTFGPDGKRVLTLSSARNDAGSVSFLGGEQPEAPDNDPGPQTRIGHFGGSGSIHMNIKGFGEPKVAILWDADTGKEVTALKKRAPWLFSFGHVWHPTAAALSPDGKQVAVAFAENDAALWDSAKGGYERVVLKGHGGAVNDIAFSPDGKKVATAGYDATVRLWDVATAKELLRLRGHQGAVNSVQFSPDGKELLSTSDDKTARVWDVATGEEWAALKGHSAKLVSAGFSPDGHHVATAGDTTLRIWDLTHREPATVLRGHQGRLVALQFSADGRRLLTAAPDETARLWDTRTGGELAVLGKDKKLGEIRSAQFADGGKRVLTASANARVIVARKVINESAVHLWDAATGSDVLALKGHGEGALAALCDPSGRLLLTVSDGQVRTVGDAGKLDMPKGGLSNFKNLTTLMTQGGPGNFDQVRIWDGSSGKLLATLPKPLRRNFVPSFSPDGRKLLLAFDGDRGGVVYIVEAATGKTLLPLRTQPNNWGNWGELFSAFSPDGRLVVSAANGAAYVWDAATGQLRATLQGFGMPLRSAAFSPDGRRLVTLAGNFGYVWDTVTRRVLAVLKDHEGRITTVAFSADGKRLVTGSEDRTAILWEAATGRMLAFYRGHTAAVTHVAFSPDGAQVATGSADGTARLWQTNFLPVIAQRRPRELTQPERDRYEIQVAGAAGAPGPGTAAPPVPLPSAIPPPGAALPEPWSLPPKPLDAATLTLLNHQLDRLRAAVKGAPTDAPEVQKELLAIQKTRAGTPQAMEAARLAMQLPSPLDGLDGSKIPAAERFTGQPKELVAVLGEQRQRHSGGVNRLAVSRDGKLVASGGADNVIHVWEADSLHERCTLSGNLAGFGADGRTLVTLADGLLHFWDLTSPKPKESSSFKIGPASVSAITTDGKLLICHTASGQMMTLWDLSGPAPRQRGVCAADAYVDQLALSPDGTRLAISAQGGKVRLLDLTGSEPKQRAILEGNYQWAGFVVFAPDGQTLAAEGKDRTIRLWDLRGSKPRERAVLLKGKYPHGIDRLAFAPDGNRLATSGWVDHGVSHVLRLWDISGGQPVEKASLPGFTDGIRQLVFSPDGNLLVTGGGNTVRFWDLAAKPPRERSPLHGHTNAVLALAFAPDRPWLASSSSDGTLRLWELAGGGGQERAVSPGGAGTVAFSLDGQTLVGGDSFSPWVWDLSTGAPKLKAHLPGHSHGPFGMSLSLNGKWLASGSFSPIVRLWDLQGDKPRLHATVPNDAQGAQGVSSLALSPDGRLLVSGSQWGQRHMRAWRVTGAGLKELALAPLETERVALSPDGKTLAYLPQWGRGVHLLDLTGPVPLDRGVLDEPDQSGGSSVRGLAFSPDGSRLATAEQNGRVVVWELAGEQRLRAWNLSGSVESIAFAPDGRHLAVGNANGTIYVLRL
jgi:WD40 repeat protein